MSIIIYLISFLEWFTTLSIEIIAIRNFTPIIGTNSISTSVILWVILLALSYWYYIWWKYSKNKENEKIINKIIKNLSISSIYYLFFTFVADKAILNYFLEYTQNYFFSILISSLILFFLPVFLASQTIPLLSEILKWDNTWEKIGKLLFYSTIGSFLWSIITSTVLFPLIWVEKSAIFNSFLLSFIIIILTLFNFKKLKELNIFIIIWVLIFIISTLKLFSKEEKNKNIIYKTSNAYHNIVIYENNNQRIFSQNNWYSSWIDIRTNESFFTYIKEIKQKIIENKYENILIIWAAWFTLPQELSKNNFIKNIDVVDVDSSLKKITEKYFLQEKLSNKINFYPESSRFFINNSIIKNKKYDAVVIDIYVWKSLAPQTLTYDFFNSIKKIWNDVYINIITDSNLESIFSKKLLTTLKASFWEIFYQDVNKSLSYRTNFIMTNRNFNNYKKYISDNNIYDIYLDNKNSIEIDLFRMNEEEKKKNN